MRGRTCDGLQSEPGKALRRPCQHLIIGHGALARVPAALRRQLRADETAVLEPRAILHHGLL